MSLLKDAKQRIDDAIIQALSIHVYFSPIQACSAKSLERLRSQQESLRSLKPQVVYLRDLARGLVQDSPQTPGGSTEGAQRLQRQAEDTEKEYDDVTDKVRSSVAVGMREQKWKCVIYIFVINAADHPGKSLQKVQTLLS